MSFAVSLSITWAELVAKARRDLWAGVLLAELRAAAVPRCRHYPILAGPRVGPACLVTGTHNYDK